MTDLTPNFRALCAQLTKRLALSENPPWELIDRALAALATPPPEPPTDKELLRLGNDLMGDCLLCEPDLLLNFARAVLEKCGR